MKKTDLIIICLFLFVMIFQETYANIEIENNDTTIELINWVVVVDGDIEFKSYIDIPYDLEVNWNIRFWNWVNIFWDINATWDILGWNNITSYKTISAKNITIWNRGSFRSLISQEDLILKWDAIISRWISVWRHFSASSDLILYGNSEIRWNMTVELDTQIYGTLYVYWNVQSKENFHFEWNKLKIHWNFRTLKWSELIGRIFIFWSPARRNLYTNNLLYTYILESRKYQNLMWEIDPVLSYLLSQEEVAALSIKLRSEEDKILAQKYKILYWSHLYNRVELWEEIKKLKSMEDIFITYINNYISDHSRDRHQWNIIKYEREKDLKAFLRTYDY